jgi:hypothetical protein
MSFTKFNDRSAEIMEKASNEYSEIREEMKTVRGKTPAEKKSLKKKMDLLHSKLNIEMGNVSAVYNYTVKNEGFDDVKEWAYKYLGLLQEKKMDVEEEMIILSDIMEKEKHNLGKE